MPIGSCLTVGMTTPFRKSFPEVVDDINPKADELKYTPQRNWGYLYETLGEWQSWKLSLDPCATGEQPFVLGHLL